MESAASPASGSTLASVTIGTKTVSSWSSLAQPRWMLFDQTRTRKGSLRQKSPTHGGQSAHHPPSHQDDYHRHDLIASMCQHHQNQARSQAQDRMRVPDRASASAPKQSPLPPRRSQRSSVQSVVYLRLWLITPCVRHSEKNAGL